MDVSTQLVWRRESCRHHVAVAGEATYVLHKISGTDRWRASRNGEAIGEVVGAGVGAAKRLAQSDYEAR